MTTPRRTTLGRITTGRTTTDTTMERTTMDKTNQKDKPRKTIQLSPLLANLTKTMNFSKTMLTAFPFRS
jgi:hypothetical protein